MLPNPYQAAGANGGCSLLLFVGRHESAVAQLWSLGHFPCHGTIARHD